MSQKSIKKITMTVGVGLLTATLNPTFESSVADRITGGGHDK